MGTVQLPSLTEFEDAAAALRDVVVHTPLVPLRVESAGGGILLKPETLQRAGSFKIRGVFWAVSQLGEEQRRRGISTVSAGNTAKALAWAGRHFGVPARSLMPDSAPQTKVDAVRALGGTPVLVPTDEVFRYLKERGWEREDHAYIDPWTCRDVMVGHGSMGLEILADCPGVETVFLPVGGGGLLAGVGAALRAGKPDIRIVAVEPAGCPAFHESCRAGKPVQVACDTMCDGVAVPYMTDEMFPVLDALADDIILVSEDRVRAAIVLLAEANHLVAEGAGALAVAAALEVPASERGVSVCPVTGGSIDRNVLAQILGGSGSGS